MRRRDTGSGSLLVVGIVGCTVSSLTLGVSLFRGLADLESAEISADAAALAAADVAAGISPGSPCVVAAAVAGANHAHLDGCRVDGLVVSVGTSAEFLGLPLAASATAGPPVAVSN